MAPRAKVLPLAGVETIVGVPTLSVALGVKVTTAPAALVASAVMFAGSVRVGAVPSLTVALKLTLAVFPAASLAVSVTIVVPALRALPAAGVCVTPITPTLSLVTACEV